MALSAVQLLYLEQMDRSLEDHTRDFFDLACLTHFPDRSLCVFYISSLSERLPLVCSVAGSCSLVDFLPAVFGYLDWFPPVVSCLDLWIFAHCSLALPRKPVIAAPTNICFL
ncbi:hypothetical protein G5714_013038 [Onychostoma macrolepis]|uniref:Uncharacterized protein n=1 Tax=Onychostoma macrolepis TaxID=369639 RepID=A0A7J6CE65_9TELE|nr:hypothetical protein G5714_013038 [Onychostoma macrolepis]